MKEQKKTNKRAYYPYPAGKGLWKTQAAMRSL